MQRKSNSFLEKLTDLTKGNQFKEGVADSIKKRKSSHSCLLTNEAPVLNKVKKTFDIYRIEREGLHVHFSELPVGSLKNKRMELSDFNPVKKTKKNKNQTGDYIRYNIQGEKTFSLLSSNGKGNNKSTQVCKRARNAMYLDSTHNTFFSMKLAFQDNTVAKGCKNKDIQTPNSTIWKVEQVLDQRGDSNCTPSRNSQDREYTKIPQYKKKPWSVPFISADTLTQIITSRYDRKYKDVVILDCRFPYEYHGGHILGAKNVSLDNIEEICRSLKDAEEKLIVFHCEFSIKRGPTIAQKVHTNLMEYFGLERPDMCILDGGYCEFFKENKTFCTPKGYLPMNDARYVEECEARISDFDKKHKPKKIRYRIHH
ncbi:hypothetical protein BB560_001081 [Smittium megazygosporum]|uniref:protein-tyrosine-phosphatase n=1 Tax=Smittium megazygosporum TaxID=133381 RepID=A0A2T9ZIL7_9FUNG|nr:hypothetical protein BB560_001081 [Smittium megazygosporum]